MFISIFFLSKINADVYLLFLVRHKLDDIECTPSQFRCDTTKCLPLDKRCNGHPDCSDYTDEKNCRKFGTKEICFTELYIMGNCLVLCLCVEIVSCYMFGPYVVKSSDSSGTFF